MNPVAVAVLQAQWSDCMAAEQTTGRSNHQDDTGGGGYATKTTMFYCYNCLSNGTFTIEMFNYCYYYNYNFDRYCSMPNCFLSF